MAQHRHLGHLKGQTRLIIATAVLVVTNLTKVPLPDPNPLASIIHLVQATQLVQAT